VSAAYFGDVFRKIAARWEVSFVLEKNSGAIEKNSGAEGNKEV
jgi:hypothetical protein